MDFPIEDRSTPQCWQTEEAMSLYIIKEEVLAVDLLFIEVFSLSWHFVAAFCV